MFWVLDPSRAPRGNSLAGPGRWGGGGAGGAARRGVSQLTETEKTGKTGNMANSPVRGRSWGRARRRGEGTGCAAGGGGRVRRARSEDGHAMSFHVRSYEPIKNMTVLVPYRPGCNRGPYR
ncbi:hypothetical protein GCM10010421_04370 [Streptomyces glaucus]|uniref:Secreted protein n=1 Tax=Streptomyces glaucus TaxID=284029 RepID=A0ABP5WAC6_9ACTN